MPGLYTCRTYHGAGSITRVGRWGRVSRISDRFTIELFGDSVVGGSPAATWIF